MKRFHVHVSVKDLSESTAFYSALFGRPPTVARAGYAKWMLEDPRLNFAISIGGLNAGIDHLGMEVDSPGELAELRLVADDAAGSAVRVQGEVSCCHARSDKHWTLDPQGIAWEHFRTLGMEEAFGEAGAAREAGACCIPLAAGGQPSSVAAGAPCCLPPGRENACCG